MDIETRISKAMRQLERTIARANADPQAVLQGSFRGCSRSGGVTVWVDALGRVERCHIAPDYLREGDEQRLADEFMQANTAARQAAENLDIEGSDSSSTGSQERTARRRQPRDEDDDTGYGETFLRPVR